MNVPTTSNGLRLEDCMCPICLEILIEPVTMPCKHELCMPCFQQNVQVFLYRPDCNVLLRENLGCTDMPDADLWRQIRKFFPKEVTNRMSGRSDYESVAVPPVHEVNHILAAPGEIKQEYEDQIRRFTEQLNLEREQEEAASRAFIEKLQAFEAARLQVEENDSYIAHHLGHLCETDQDVGVIYDQIAAEIAPPNQSGATTSSSIPDSALFTATSNIQTVNSTAVSRYQIAGDTFEFASQRPQVVTVGTQTPAQIATQAESQDCSSLITSLNRSSSFRDKVDAQTITEPPMATIWTMSHDLRSSNQPNVTGWVGSTACSCSSCLPENSRAFYALYNFKYQKF
uniref:RING-type E3 ubiquitin transferase n=1 Tax=Romanomermis culicivorax TaxID=13658 RepID=A0A915HF20_ROMCU